MIDWDEVNWGKGIAIILAGIVLVGGGIFVVNDYMSYQRLNSQLISQIEDLDNFYSTWSPPSEVEMLKMEQKLNDLQKFLQSSSVIVPGQIDFGEIENLIRSQAQANNVQLYEVNILAEESTGFFNVQPVEVSFEGSEEPVANFLRRVDQIQYAHQMEASMLSFGEAMDVKIKFYIFDTKEWNDFYDCKTSVTFPEIENVNIDKIRIFKGNLAQLKSQVDSKLASLKDTKQAANNKCELEGRIGALEEKVKLIKELTPE
jgi:hypothetical protein